MSPAARAALTRMAIEAGQRVRTERSRRRWTMRDLADRAGVGATVVHDVETGDVVSLASYARLATALGLRPELLIADPRARPTARDGGTDVI